MNLDHKMLTGILIGVILGLKYYMSLEIYLPILIVTAVIMVLRTLHDTRTR